ncbi:hypothetical protein Q3G72_024982 [Acer saccharum]|nr:hypothetical protein Q3G72_024982 [Acer saccharum]
MEEFAIVDVGFPPAIGGPGRTIGPLGGPPLRPPFRPPLHPPGPPIAWGNPTSSTANSSILRSFFLLF